MPKKNRSRSNNNLGSQNKRPQNKEGGDQTLLVHESHEGPLPPPAVLDHYNKISPGAAERIIAMAEKEQNHRQKQDEDTLTANIKDRKSVRSGYKLGQVLAFLLCSLVVVSGTYVAISGAAWPGVILGATGLAGVITAFLKR